MLLKYRNPTSRSFSNLEFNIICTSVWTECWFPKVSPLMYKKSKLAGKQSILIKALCLPLNQNLKLASLSFKSHIPRKFAFKTCKKEVEFCSYFKDKHKKACCKAVGAVAWGYYEGLQEAASYLERIFSQKNENKINTLEKAESKKSYEEWDSVSQENELGRTSSIVS